MSQKDTYQVAVYANDMGRWVAVGPIFYGDAGRVEAEEFAASFGTPFKRIVKATVYDPPANVGRSMKLSPLQQVAADVPLSELERLDEQGFDVKRLLFLRQLVRSGREARA